MSRLILTLFFVAVGTLVIGVELLAAPSVIAAGIVLLGLTALVVGIDVLRTGRVFFQPSGPHALRLRAESYSGAAARVWGLFFILAGLLTMGGAIVLAAARDRALAVLDRLFDTSAGWGLLLALVGTFLTLYGLTRLLGGGGVHVASTRVWIRHWAFRLFGGACVAVGIVLVGIGVVLVTAPDAPQEWFGAMFPRLP